LTEAIFCLIALIIGSGILIVSMMLTSNVLGGVEFGALSAVILKAMGLLVIVDLVALIPTAGIFLTIPIWWLGLMYLFQIDFWECRTLVAINWLLNVLVLAGLKTVLMSQSAGQIGDLP